MELLASLALCWRKEKKKNPPLLSDGSQRCSEAAPKSLSADACKWAHMAPLYLQHQRVDEIDDRGCDHDETAQQSTSCMMDALMSQSYIRRKQDHQSAAQRVAALARFSVTCSCCRDGVDFSRRAAEMKIERKHKRHRCDWRGTVVDNEMSVPIDCDQETCCAKMNFINVFQHKNVTGKFIASTEKRKYLSFASVVLPHFSLPELGLLWCHKGHLYTSQVSENTSKTATSSSSWFVPFYTRTHKRTHTLQVQHSSCNIC